MSEFVIIDTDLGCDCDDAGALAIANIFHTKRIGKLLALTHTINDPAGIKCIRAINDYYGNDFLIGMSHYTRYDYKKSYKKFARDFEKKVEDFTCLSAVEVMKSVLKNADDNSVTIACIGQLNNLSDLLKEECNLKKKIKRVVIMGGDFRQGMPPEHNIKSDVQSAVKALTNLTDIETIFCDYAHGQNIKIGKVLKSQIANPVYEMYVKFGQSMGVVDRSSWDLVAVLYAFRPNLDCFYLSEGGVVTINADGSTDFNLDKDGKHRLLNFTVSDEEMETILNKILIDKMED